MGGSGVGGVGGEGDSGVGGVGATGMITGRLSKTERSVVVGGVVCWANGNVFSSKTTWREMMILWVARSRQR